jgi:hypothetical protein
MRRFVACRNPRRSGLEAYTLGSAYAEFQEAEKGPIGTDRRGSGIRDRQEFDSPIRRRASTQDEPCGLKTGGSRHRPSSCSGRRGPHA